MSDQEEGSLELSSAVTEAAEVSVGEAKEPIPETEAVNNEKKDDVVVPPEQPESDEAAEGKYEEAQDTNKAETTNEDNSSKKKTAAKASPKKGQDLKKESVKKETPKRTAKEKEVSTKSVVNVQSDEKVALLDSPLVVEGRRQRHVVERLATALPIPLKKKTHADGDGHGTPLTEIPFIATQIDKKKAAELKVLHRICFGHAGKATEVKKNLRKFNGFPFDKSSKEYESRKASILRLTLSEAKEIRRFLGFNKGGTKEEEASIILDFLLDPKDTGKKVQVKTSKRKRSSTSKKSNIKAKAKKEEDDSEDGNGDEDEEDAPPAKKVKRETKKAKEPKTSKEVKAESEESESSESSKDESEEKEPTDEEVKKAVKELLETVDLTKVSMKQMCGNVVDRFPNSKLGERKTFLKDLIKAELAEKDT